MFVDRITQKLYWTDFHKIRWKSNTWAAEKKRQILVVIRTTLRWVSIGLWLRLELRLASDFLPVAAAVGTNFGVGVGEARPEVPRARGWGSWGGGSQPLPTR